MHGNSAHRPPAWWRAYAVNGVLPLLAGLFLLWVLGSHGGLDHVVAVVTGREAEGGVALGDTVTRWVPVVVALVLAGWCCWRAYGLVRALRGGAARGALTWEAGPRSPRVPFARGPRSRVIGMGLCLAVLAGGFVLLWQAGGAVVAAETFGVRAGSEVTTTVVHREFQSRTSGSYRYSGRCRGQRLTFEYRDPDDGALGTYEEGFCDNDPLSRLEVGDTVPARTVPGSSALLVDHRSTQYAALLWPALVGLAGAATWCTAQLLWYRRLVRRGADLYVGRARVRSFVESRAATFELRSGDRFDLEVLRRGLTLAPGEDVRLWASRLDWRGRPAGPWVVDGRGRPMAMSHVVRTYGGGRG